MNDPRPTGIPADFAPVIEPDRSFDALYGLELLDDGSSDGTLRARVAIRDELLGPFGQLHGGVLAALAEALASRGTWVGAGGGGKLVMGMSNDTRTLAPLTSGTVHAAATTTDRGEGAWLWEVRACDDTGRLCAVSVVNVAIRAPR